MKALLSKLWNGTKQLWNRIMKLNFIYYIIAFIFCDMFYPQYSDILAKVVMVGLAIMLFRDIDDKFIPEVSFISKLDDPLIGRNYAIIIAAAIAGICYIVGS